MTHTTLTTLLDLPSEIIFDIALHTDRGTQFSMSNTSNYLRDSLDRLTPIFNKIHSIRDRRMKHILKDSGWNFLLNNGSVTPIPYHEDLALDFLYIKRPITCRNYSFKIGENFNFSGFQKLLRGNQFHYLEFEIDTNDSLVWSILGEVNTRDLSLIFNNEVSNETTNNEIINETTNNEIINETTNNRTNNETNNNTFQSFAMKSSIVNLTLSRHFTTLFFEYAYLFKNLESITFDCFVEDFNINLNQIHNQCPKLKSIVSRYLYESIIENNWQMDEMKVYLSYRAKPPPPPPKQCTKLTIIVYSFDGYFDLFPLRDSLLSLTLRIESCYDISFINDFLQDNQTLEELDIYIEDGSIDRLPFNQTLEELDIYIEDGSIDLLPFNLNLKRFRVCLNSNYCYLMSKFIASQKNIEVFCIVSTNNRFNEDVWGLIEALKDNVYLKSIEICPRHCFDFKCFHLDGLINVLKHFRGRDLVVNGVPIDSILRDVDPKKIRILDK